MAFEAKGVEVTLEVVAAPGAFLSAAPPSLVVAKGDVARFNVSVTRTNGYTGPIYLRVANYATDEQLFSVNPVPPGSAASELAIDTSAWPVGKTTLLIEPSDVPFVD